MHRRARFRTFVIFAWLCLGGPTTSAESEARLAIECGGMRRHVDDDEPPLESLLGEGLSPMDEFDDALAKDVLREKKHTKERRGPKIWDQWGKWSACSVTCGVGKIVRWRHCIGGGCALGEKEAQIKGCTLPAC